MYEEYDSVRFFFFFEPPPFGFLADFLAGVFFAGGIFDLFGFRIGIYAFRGGGVGGKP